MHRSRFALALPEYRMRRSFRPPPDGHVLIIRRLDSLDVLRILIRNLVDLRRPRGERIFFYVCEINTITRERERKREKGGIKGLDVEAPLSPSARACSTSLELGKNVNAHEQSFRCCRQRGLC